MTQNNTLPFYFRNIENMTVAAVKFQAKLWADTFRKQMPWDNGDGYCNVMHAALTSRVRSDIKPEDIDALEAKIVELTLSPTAIDEHEEKRGCDTFENDRLSYGRASIHVDYHACGVLAAALKALDEKVGRRLDMLVPCKSQSSIGMAGVDAAFGYGAPDRGVWSTLKEVSPDEYTVINRFATDGGRDGERWEAALEEDVGELVWVQLARDSVEPKIQIYKALGYVKTYSWRDTVDEYYGRGNEGGFAYACSRVLQQGYLGLAVLK